MTSSGKCRFILILCTALLLTVALHGHAAQNANPAADSKAIGVAEAVKDLPNSLKTPNRYGLVIGVGQYEDERIRRLQACSNDAMQLYKTLLDPSIGMFKPGNVTLLQDKGVTRAKVVKAGDVFTNSIGMNLVWIPEGQFMMGTSLSAKEMADRLGGEEKDYTDEHPRHPVRISQGFWMGQTEVTRKQFRAFVQGAGYETTAERTGKGYGLTKEGWALVDGLHWQSPGFLQTDDHPAVQISSEDAQAFCRWLSKKEGRTYRLPSEAQWEYACRAGTDTVFFWGNTTDGGQGYANMADEAAQRWISTYSRSYYNDRCKWDDGYANTAPGGRFRPNSFGLYDMHGNVWEWCNDWYDADYYSKSPSADPPGPITGTSRVLRGGSWFTYPRYCHSADRSWHAPVLRPTYGGFRIVLDSN